MSATIDETRRTGEVALPQYSRGRVLGVWAAAAIPMGVLAWVVAPLLAHAFSGPAALPRALVVALTAGLAWQMGMVLGLVYREQETLRWPVLRDALWLRAPRSPRTGRRGGRLWWVVLPLAVAFAAEELIPKLPHPGDRDLGLFFGSDAGHAFMNGAWGWFALMAVMFVLNTVVGEELLFRGLLLPRMSGAFGRGDWAVNGGLFALYHLHVPWAIPSILVDSFILAGPARRYRSALVSIAVHSTQTVVFLLLGLGLVLGLG